MTKITELQMRAKKGHSGRIETRPRALAAAAFAYRRVWEAACKHDGIPTDTKFAVFSDGNPYTKFIDNAFAHYAACRREYESGGYVGLEIERGK
jgi:hypothetical protein